MIISNSKLIKYSFLISFFCFTVPFFNIFLNSQSSILFPAYTKEFTNFLYFIFFLAPIILILIFFLILKKISVNFEKIYIFLMILIFLKNFDFYLSYELRYLNKFFLIRYLILMISSYYLTSISANFKIEFYTNKIFNVSVIAFLIISIFFYFQSFSKFYKIKNVNIHSKSKVDSNNNNNQIKNIIILTFEKLPRVLFYNEKDQILQQYDNLKKINFINFKNFKSTGLNTTNGLQNLYTGVFSNISINKDEDYKESIFKYLNKLNYKIFFINDYLNYPCQEIYISCIKSIENETENFQKKLFLANWFFNFSKIYVPRAFFQRLNLDILDKVNFNSIHQNVHNQTFVDENNKIEKIFNENPSVNKAIIMHSFLTDGPMEFNKNYKNTDYYNKYFVEKRLEDFDKIIGNIFLFLKNKNILENTLIFISSDTGSNVDLDISNAENNTLINEILAIMYYKNKNIIYDNLLFQHDFISILKNILNDDFLLRGIKNKENNQKLVDKNSGVYRLNGKNIWTRIN